METKVLQISEYQKNMDVHSWLLLKEFHLKKTKDGKLYLDLLLGDATGTIRGKVWNNAETFQSGFKSGMPLGISGIVDEFNGDLQLTVSRMVEVSEATHGDKGFSWGLLLPVSSKDIQSMWEDVQEAIASMENEFLKPLVESIYSENEDQIKKHPASMILHHAFIGGFLEHNHGMLKLAMRAAEQYPVDKDLLISGILLHDIGKLTELNGFPNNTYTGEGNFLGHIVMGWDMVNRRAEKIDNFPPELKTKLGHIILSHQGEYEYQSPKKPAILEALIIHYIDELDARVNMFQKILNDDNTDSDWTTNKNYFKVPLFKNKS